MSLKLSFLGAIQMAFIAVCSVSSGGELFPALRDGRLGYSDRKGQIIIPCQFDPVFPGPWGSLVPSTAPQDFEFSEGIAVVSDGEKCGAIDETGRWIFRERYRHIERFHDGIAIAHDETGVGFLRRDGSWLVKPTFSSCLPFSEGLAAVSLKQADKKEAARSPNLWGFIDTSGKTQIPISFALVKSFHEGLAAARDSANGKWGFIDVKGEWSVKPQFDDVVDPLENGLAVVEQHQRPFFVDRTGAEVVSKRFQRAGQFAEGLAACTVFTPLGLRVGFIDRSGKFAIPPQYLETGSFSEGLCGVRLREGWAYIDHSGNTVIKARRVFSTGQFRNGVATLSITWDRRAFLFRDGTVLVEDGDGRHTETDFLDDDSVGLIDDKLIAELAEKKWSLNVQELPLSGLPIHVVHKLPSLPRETTHKRVVGVRNGITGTWWLVKEVEGRRYTVFHNRYLPSDFLE